MQNGGLARRLMSTTYNGVEIRVVSERVRALFSVSYVRKYGVQA